MSEEQAVSKEPAPALPELKINLASDGKAEIRTKVWDYLSDNKLTTFPWPPHKRNPNFKGSEEAGDKAIKMDVFGKAKVIKVDADKPLQEVRIKAMEEHKSVLVPTPRLRYGFLNKIVPPEDADKKMFKICATRQGLEEYSQPVGIDDKLHVDIVAVGAVAVSPKGWKIGKGEGYSDLEYAVMAALGMVDSSTSVVAVVHDSQVLDLPDKVFSKHDVPVDYIITPTRVIKCDGRPARPAGIIWSLLDADKLGSTPILRKLRYRDWKAGKDVKLSGETEAPADLEDEELKMEDDAEKRPRQRRPFRRGFGRRRGRGGNRGGDGDRDVSKSDGDGDAKVNGSGGGRRRGGYRSFRGGWGRRGRGGRRGGSRGDGGRQREDSENDGGHSGDERSSPRRGGGYRRRGGFRPRRGFDDYEGSVYVGSLPRSLRVSDFKGEVRDRKVNPLRVMWRGSSGFAFLNFKTHQEAEEALVALEGLSFEDRAPRLEMAKERERNRGSRRRGQRADSHSGGEDDEGED